MDNEKTSKVCGGLLENLTLEERKEFMFNVNTAYLMENGFTEEQASAIAVILSKCVMKFGDIEI